MKTSGEFISKNSVSGNTPTESKRINWLRYVPGLLILVGIGLIGGSIAIDLIGIGGQSGFGSRQLMLSLGGVSLLLSGINLLTFGKQKQIGEWLLIGIGAIGVAITSDLFIETSLPKFGIRQLLISPILLSVVIPGAVAAIEQESFNAWFKAITSEWKSGLKIFSVLAQLALLLIVVNQYDLENRAFSQNILPLIFYGFLIHCFLPLRLRLPFFLLLSIAAILGIFGFTNGVWLLILGFVLIAICHLPIPFLSRVVLLLAAGLALALLRADIFSYAWSGAIWPILGSMFMFRLIIYMYDLKHRKEPFSPVNTLSYFFMLPNIVFPLFPVVDYANYRRTYFDTDRYEIYQKGLDWILRGVVHLLLYRYVSYYLVISPEQVINVNDLIRYILSTFLLYLRVSGQFHMIVGILHLFGFNLPETHHLYYLASSFTDFWRRINIYWKDFMLKVFYYPGYFQLRKLGPTPALIISTLFVFFVTWFFHAYQWFWLRGSFLLTWTDTLFWAILAILVVINSIYESRYGKKRTLSKPTWTWTGFTSLALRTTGTFVTIALLWTLWSSASLSEFFSLWSVEGLKIDSMSSLIPLWLLTGLVLGGSSGNVTNGKIPWLQTFGKPSFFRSVLVTGISTLLLCLIAIPAVYSQFGVKSQELIRDMKVARLNARDAALLQRGYYEDLIGVNRFNNQLWEVYMNRPGDKAELNNVDVTQPTGNFLKHELRPLIATIHFKFENVPFRTNRWGMRDQDYEKIPPPNSYRIAVLGASAVMGWGVGDNETFESLLEERLNQDIETKSYAKYEILNFGVADYSPFQELMLLETKVFDFEPDAVFYMAHQYDEEVAMTHLIETVQAGVDIPYEYLGEIASKAGIDAKTSETLGRKRLAPYGTEMLSWTYRQIVENCRKRGVLPVWVFMPTLELSMSEEKVATLNQLADEAGFIVLDLGDYYGNQDIKSLWVEEWDNHPNAKAHELLANRLYEVLLEQSERIPLGLQGGNGSP